MPCWLTVCGLLKRMRILAEPERTPIPPASLHLHWIRERLPFTPRETVKIDDISDSFQFNAWHNAAFPSTRLHTPLHHLHTPPHPTTPLPHTTTQKSVKGKDRETKRRRKVLSEFIMYPGNNAETGNASCTNRAGRPLIMADKEPGLKVGELPAPVVVIIVPKLYSQREREREREEWLWPDS